MTISFHKYGEYFLITGDVRDIGAGRGKCYLLNFPLQCGADSISGDLSAQPTNVVCLLSKEVYYINWFLSEPIE